MSHLRTFHPYLFGGQGNAICPFNAIASHLGDIVKPMICVHNYYGVTTVQSMHIARTKET